MSSDLSHLPPKLSVMLYQAATIEALYKDVEQCIDAGIKTVYIPDHLIGGGDAATGRDIPWLSMIPLLMDIANKYPELNIGTLVASPSLRSAAQLSVDAATIAHIVGKERFLLSIGSGGADSDQLYQNENLTPSDIAQRFSSYIDDVVSYENSTHNPPLRLASRFNIRVACDSMKTIDVVLRANTAWVTSGGFKKPLESRISKINKLWNHLKTNGYTGSVAVCADSPDGISLESTSDDLAQYAGLYDAPVEEIIITLFHNRG